MESMTSVKKRFDDLGLSYWIDVFNTKTINPEQTVISPPYDGMDESGIVVFLSSARSNKSSRIKGLIQHARSIGKEIFPIYIDDAPVNEELNIPNPDFNFSTQEDAIETGLKPICDILGKPFQGKRNVAKPQYEVFISYSRKDINKVRKIKAEIERVTGVPCWMDMEGIEGGVEFEEVIVSAIDKSRVVLFIMSEGALKSEGAKQEIRYAKKTGKKLVPVNIDNSKLEGWFLFTFAGIDIIDYNNKDQKEKLFSNIREWIKPQGGKTERPEETGETDLPIAQSNKKKFWLISLFVLLLSIVAAGLHFMRGTDPELAVASPTPVDLGLPSGTLWGDRNVGASGPIDHGKLYSWGDVTEKDEFHEYDYKNKPKVSQIRGTKYDVAAKLHAHWVTPSKKEFQELIDNCKWVRTKLGCKIIGPNGNSIFLPYAGRSYSAVPEYVGQYAYYWTSDGKVRESEGISVRFPTVNYAAFESVPAYSGRSVRPVYKTK